MIANKSVKSWLSFQQLLGQRNMFHSNNNENVLLKVLTFRTHHMNNIPSHHGTHSATIPRQSPIKTAFHSRQRLSLLYFSLLPRLKSNPTNGIEKSKPMYKTNAIATGHRLGAMECRKIKKVSIYCMTRMPEL